jgi:hypothetical protein
MTWNYCPRTLRKSTCGFVGLQNLGATCYMNSVLQQIFMVPEFRAGLLSCVVDPSTADENTQILFQLQRIFSYLQVRGWPSGPLSVLYRTLLLVSASTCIFLHRSVISCPFTVGVRSVMSITYEVWKEIPAVAIVGFPVKGAQT